MDRGQSVADILDTMSFAQVMFKGVEIKRGRQNISPFRFLFSFFQYFNPYYHLSFAHLYAGGMDAAAAAAAAAFRDSEAINMAGAPLTARAKETRREREAGGRKGGRNGRRRE